MEPFFSLLSRQVESSEGLDERFGLFPARGRNSLSSSFVFAQFCRDFERSSAALAFRLSPSYQRTHPFHSTSLLYGSRLGNPIFSTTHSNLRSQHTRGIGARVSRFLRRSSSTPSSLSPSITHLYSKVAETGVWPARWNVEHAFPLKKVPTPITIDDIRAISVSPMLPS